MEQELLNDFYAYIIHINIHEYILYKHQNGWVVPDMESVKDLTYILKLYM